MIFIKTLKRRVKMLINDEIIFRLDDDIPSVEYGEAGDTEWLDFENISLIISGRSEEVIEQIIKNLQMIKKHLKERK